MDTKRAVDLERCLNFVLPYLNLTDLVLLARTNTSVVHWLKELLPGQGFVTFDILSDDECASSIVHSLIQSSRKRKLIFGRNMSESGFASLTRVLSSCSSVTDVDFQQCDQVPAGAFEHVLEARYLDSIIFASLWRLDDETVATTAKHCNDKMKNLNLSRCYRITDASIREIRGLKRLNLERCVNILHPDTLSVVAIQNPHLLELNLSSLSSLVTDDSLQQTPSLEMLETLVLDSCHQLSDDSLVHISRIAPKLQHLSLSRCTGLNQIDLLLSNLSSTLIHLDVSGCEVFASDCSALRTLKNLQHFEAKQSDLCDYAMEFLGDLPRLESLVLSGCKALTDAGLQAFAKTNSVHTLIQFHVGACPNLTNGGLASLFARRGRKLQSIQLPPNSTDATLHMVHTLLPNLASIDMGKALAISDMGVASLTASLGHSIVNMKLDETSITDKVFSILLRCTRLEKLTGYGCASTSAEGFEFLDRQAGVHLKTLMDKEGRMLRSKTTHVASGTSKKRRGGYSKSLIPSVNVSSSTQNFLSVEAPMFIVSCVALAIDWYFS